VTDSPKSRRVTVCDACLTASCWHGTFQCQRARTAGTTTRTVAELDAVGAEHPSHYSATRVRAITGSDQHQPEPVSDSVEG
jgi:hypothetical protein